MNFDTWTVKRTDALRVRRLMVGWVVGAISVAASMAFIVLSSKGAGAAVEEEEGPIEVQLAREAEPAEPPPPPPPPEEKPKPQAPRPKLASPLAVPDDKPAEKDPPPQQVVEQEEEEKPAEPAIASAAPPPPPAPIVRAKPAVKKPIRLTEDMPKPVQIVMKTPDYPSDAKAAGIEGVVVVKYVIGEDGSVRDVKALKGPPELQSVCVEAVRSWRFSPVIVDGAAVAVVRMARFPFRIR
ncbi:MAG TPA: TonB family protein [Polyangiaceae bacterium]